MVLARKQSKEIFVTSLKFLVFDGHIMLNGFVVMDSHIHMIWQRTIEFPLYAVGWKPDGGNQLTVAENLRL